MSKLKVSFGDPEHGWIGLNIQVNAQVIEIDASDIYPSFCLLVDALRFMVTFQGATIVTWTCEPTEYDFCFLSRSDLITLEIYEWPGTKRTEARQDAAIVVSVSGAYDEICLPFWRAMRELQSRFSRKELEERWTNTFPHEELDKLTELLGKS